VIVLAIDTCDSRGGVTLLRGDEIAGISAHETGEDYSSWLLPAVDRVLKTAGVRMAEVYGYGVAAGPGSFTGVRVGLTTVKAWGEVSGKPIAAVSRLEAVALQAGGGEANYIAACLDAQRGQVFGAVYLRRAGGLVRLGDEMVIGPGKFVATAVEMAGGGRVAWASTDPDCLLKLPEWQERAKLSEAIEPVAGFLAGAVARKAAKELAAGRHTDALALDANYVRRSDAEIFWKGSSARGS
jgi:tRNA threonylcarbamoyladenosine biosynthesis protein TsaB